jgi:hypothetical protein
MVSTRSSEIVPRIQVRTTAFIRTQSGEVCTTSERTWHSRENLVRVSRKDTPPSVESGVEVEDKWHERADVLHGDCLGV